MPRREVPNDVAGGEHGTSARGAPRRAGAVRSRLELVLGYTLLWLVALGLRVAFRLGVADQETLRADGLRYVTLAWNLVNNGIYSDAMEPPLEPHTRWPPGYPGLLALLFAGRGLVESVSLAMWTQVILASTLPLLVVALGRRVMPAGAAWCAGLLTACCPVLVTSPAFLVTESTFTLLLFLMLLALVPVLERPSMSGAAVVGLVAGFLALVRSSALFLPFVVAAYLAFRGAGPGRHRAAIALLLVALSVTVPWEVRRRVMIAHGAKPLSSLVEGLATSLYPDFRYGDAPRGYPMTADPRFAEFSTSLSGVLGETWRRTLDDPWPNLRWQLAGKWVTLWEFDEIQSPPIHVYPVRNGLFRPASKNPTGQTEPLAAFYWVFRALYYPVVAAVLIGAVVVWRRRGDTLADRITEALYVVLGYTVIIHSIVHPLPRYMWPMRPILFLLALRTGTLGVRAWRRGRG